MRFLRLLAGYRRRDKEKNADIRQDQNIQFTREVKEIPAELLLTYLTNVNLSNFLEDIRYHPEGRRERRQPPRRWKDQFV
jgi:hypothetical protein